MAEGNGSCKALIRRQWKNSADWGLNWKTSVCTCETWRLSLYFYIDISMVKGSKSHTHTHTHTHIVICIRYPKDYVDYIKIPQNFTLFIIFWLFYKEKSCKMKINLRLSWKILLLRCLHIRQDDFDIHKQTVLLQAIQFNISTQFSFIWPIDRTLSGATIPDLNETGSNGNEWVFYIPQSSSITGTSPSDCLVSYLGHSLGGGLTLLQRCSRCILQPAGLHWNCVLTLNWIIWNRTVYMYKSGFAIKPNLNLKPLVRKWIRRTKFES